MTNLSREYAEALFELASEENQTEAVDEALKQVAEICNAEKDFQALLVSPAIPVQNRVDVLEKAFSGCIPTRLLALLRMLVSRGHIGLLSKIVDEYHLLLRTSKGITLAKVTSAVALTGEEIEKLKVTLEKRMGKSLEIHCETDPSLLGGLRVAVDGKILDGSIRSKLLKIREVMDT